VLGRGSCPGKKMPLTCGPGMSAGKEREKKGEKDTPSGFYPAGPWAASRARPNRYPPAPFFLFFSNSFSFSLF
jgi:hypothetical protein